MKANPNIYRLLSYGTLRFFTEPTTKGDCEKRKVAYTAGQRKNAIAAGFRVTVFPVEIDPKRPSRLTPEIVAAINHWREITGKKPVSVRSRTKPCKLF